jgi:hypothetical protein
LINNNLIDLIKEYYMKKLLAILAVSLLSGCSYHSDYGFGYYQPYGYYRPPMYHQNFYRYPAREYGRARADFGHEQRQGRHHQ